MNQPQQQQQNDPNNLKIKDQNSALISKNDPELIATSKFYSKPPIAPPPQPQQQQLDIKKEIKEKKKQQKNKLSMGTWQADITSQLLLPDDFTPELISQLASEGYDVVSAGGRKARSRQTQPSFVNNFIDSSDEENNNNNDDDSNGNNSKKEHVPFPTVKSSRNNNSSNSNSNSTGDDYRKINRNAVVKQDFQDPTDHPSYKRFNQILDDLLDSFEQDLMQLKTNSNDEDEIPSEYLLSRMTCSELVQEAFKLNQYSIMNSIRRESLVKLQNLLFFNIKDGLRSMHLMNDDNNLATTNPTSEQDKLIRDLLIEKLQRTADCSIISLIIMTSPKISKELIIEDIIEQISQFVKILLTQILFPFYDPVYKPVVTSSHIKEESSNNKSSKRKLLNQFQTNSSSTTALANQKAKIMQNFHNRMREILNLFGELVCQIDMTDTIVITLSSLCVMCFFVENINDLQLETLKILTNLFTRYSKHRQLVFDDILSSLIKLHPTKRNSRCYKCFNGDSIQMFSALLLQLIQCEVNTIDYFQSSNNNDMLASYINGNSGVEAMDQNQAVGTGQKNEVTFEEKESYIINSYDNSCQTAKKFLSVFFAKCKTKQADSDFRPIFENFIQDLLTTVNKPEWPVSETILNLLGIILVNQIQNDQNDVGSRVNSLEYLGQIVSQLRKDSLEYQKYPEKVKQVIDKINSNLSINYSSENNLESLNLTDKEIFNLQKSLIKYLDSLVANDSSLQYSKFYLVGQWLKELDNLTQSNNSSNNNSDGIEYGQERINKHNALEENRKRLYSLIESQHKNKNDDETEISSNIILEMSEAFILSKYLCSMKKTLDKNFDYYLINILSLSGGGSESQTPTQVRSKAIKCLSLIIEADPQILLKQKVFACVEANFLHQTISVREASVDLIGRFITLKPELTNHYYKLLSDRILDVGVSVRKRVIKIFRDVCLNQPDFEHLSEICCKILRRINDEDGIKKLVIDTFYSLWFSPITGPNSREQLLKRVLNLVDVVSEFNAISCNVSTEIFEQLFNCLISSQAQGSASGTSLTSISNTDINQSDSKTSISASSSSTSAGGGGSGSTTNEQELQLIKSKEVLKSCKQIVDCLIENVLNTEANTSSTQSYKRLVASFSTLYLLSKIKPENFINHAETLLPYLNIKSTNQNDNQIINSAARILECVIPLLQSPSNSFLITLEESLCKLIFQGGMLIVSSCISCLGTVVNKLTKNYKLAADCFSKFYNNISYLKRTVNLSKPLEAQTKPIAFRMLFTLGLLSKHFDVESPEFADYKICSKQDLFQMFIFFMKSCDVDVQHKALIGLGSFLTRYSEYMMKDEIKKLYLTYIQHQNIPFILKSQIFINLTDYLNEEDQRNLAKSVELSKNHGCKDDLKEMLDVQSGMASTIIQSYLKPILDSYLTPNTTLRINVFNCLSMILNQGLVYPIECVPYLIAMTTDQEKKIQSRSLSHLTNLQKAHPGFVQSKSIAGVNVSFLLQKIIKKSQIQQAAATNNNAQTEVDNVVRGFSEQGELLSLNHHLYSLLRTNRSYRRAFLQQLLKMFDDSSLHHTSLAHMLFISDNLAYFPYQLMDEPLYLIHQIDLIISVTGINLLQTFKENLLNYKPTSEDNSTMQNNNKKSSQFISDDNQLSDFDNQDCPIEADEDEEAAKQHAASIIKNGENGAVKKSSELDDDDETFEVVLNNLPNDLKPLKDCMYRAQGCCLLLILKLFLKEVYSISDSKIQNYSPNDTAKVNERPITSRKTNRRFNPKQIIDYMKKSEIKKTNQDEDEDDEFKQSLVREYLEFKELILSIDQEESKFDDKSNSASGNASKTNPTDMTKVSALQQKLMEGIEKTKVCSLK